ncbi:unnamed protein product, partial [Oppiella nova]
MKILLFIALVSIVSAQFDDFDIDDYKDVVNSRNFTGKVVLVTGSSSGIGEGIVKLFSILGANVVVTGRKDTEVQKVAKEVEELSPKKLKPLQLVGDLTKSEVITTLIANTIKTFGKLDVLVNNAGIYPVTDIHQKDLLQAWDQVFNIDLRAVVELIHESVPHLEKTNGTIIEISSIAGIQPVATSLAYCPAKAGLDMLTRVLALELGPKGIRVNTLNPGVTNVAKVDSDKTIEDIIPLHRVGQPLDIAKGVAFLASSDASFITGANLVVDGGLVYNLGALFVGANFDDFDVDDYKQVTKFRNFTGKVVVVTGSSEGIGRSIIALFSILGAHVVVTGRNETVVKAVAKEMQHLSPYHLKPLEFVMNFAESEHIQELVVNTTDTFGKIDVL